MEDVENFDGFASRLESVLYSDEIVLMSSRYRTHLVETLIANREIVTRDSATEFLNDKALRRERATKYARSFHDKAHQMNQRQHTESTAVDFRNQRSRQREQTSTILHSPEKIDQC